MEIKRAKRDVFWVVSPIWKLSRFLGLAPYLLDERGSDREEAQLRYSIAILSVSTALTISLLAYAAVAGDNVEHESVVTASVNLAWDCADNLVSPILMLLLLLRRRQTRELLLGIASYDSAQKVGRSLEIERKSVDRQLFVVSGFFAGFVSYLMFSYHASQFIGYVQLLKRGVAVYWSLTNHFQLLQFYNVLMLLSGRMSRLNDNIRDFNCSLKNNSGSSPLTRDIIETRLPKSRIKIWRSLQLRLYRMCRRSSYIFGVGIFRLIFFDFMDVTIILYSLLTLDVKGESDMYNMYDTLFKSFMLFTFLCASASIVTTCEDILRKLRLFSNQLLHTRVRFTACGFFALDFNLITSMTAAIVTHIVILVQFRSAGSNGKNCNCCDVNYTAIKGMLTTSLYED